jgi:hypothetical protein
VTPFAAAEPLAGYHVRVTDEERRIPKWSFTAYRYQARWDAARKEWQERPWVQECALRVAFREPFEALAVGPDCYFVTRSGRLFRSPPGPVGKPRSVQPAWDNPARPVTAFLTDADSGRAFFFAPPAAKGGKPAFFEAAARPKPVEYDPAAVPLPKAAGPARDLLHKARVLVALRKVKGE